MTTHCSEYFTASMNVLTGDRATYICFLSLGGGGGGVVCTSRAMQHTVDFSKKIKIKIRGTVHIFGRHLFTVFYGILNWQWCNVCGQCDWALRELINVGTVHAGGNVYIPYKRRKEGRMLRRLRWSSCNLPLGTKDTRGMSEMQDWVNIF